MNQNDMGRYFWRTGQRWSSDNRPFKPQRIGRKLPKGTFVLLAAAYILTLAVLLLLR